MFDIGFVSRVLASNGPDSLPQYFLAVEFKPLNVFFL